MISYVTLGVSDLNAAKAFYSELLGEMGAKVLIDMDRISFIGKSMAAPMLAVCVPYNKEAPQAGNGTMVAFAPGSKEAIDSMYNKAIELGATCDGAPGDRIPNVFYGAYVKDPDGNKLCFNLFS